MIKALHLRKQMRITPIFDLKDTHLWSIRSPILIYHRANVESESKKFHVSGLLFLTYLWTMYCFYQNPTFQSNWISWISLSYYGSSSKTTLCRFWPYWTLTELRLELKSDEAFTSWIYVYLYFIAKNYDITDGFSNTDRFCKWQQNFHQYHEICLDVD